LNCYGGQKRETVKNAWSENAGLENAASNCRTGKRGKGMYGKPNVYFTYSISSAINRHNIVQYSTAIVAPLLAKT